MKIVYFGNNLFSSCLEYLLEEGHQILRVYKNNSLHDSSIVTRLCEKHGVALYEHEPELRELNHLISQGAELFIVAEYSYLLPVTKVKYAINIHPTLLPNGRGPTPLPYLIKLPKFSGVTIHKLCKNFDSGDIILQSKISHSIEESITTLMIKMHLKSVELLKIFIEDVCGQYKSAIPQDNFSYWPKIDASERILDWNLSVEQLKTRIKCFGHIGLIIKLNDELWRTSHVELIEYEHEFPLGNAIFEDDSILAVTSLDGIVTIHKNSMSSMFMESIVS
jgi:methionyl-tRNA formyltransferase